MWCEDNYDRWEQYEAELEKELDKLPKCAWCGNPIQDETLFDICGELYHEECVEYLFKKPTEDYME